MGLTSTVLLGAAALAFRVEGQPSLRVSTREAFPTPPRQSATQRQVYAHHAAIAKSASAAATQDVVDFFEGAEFRAGLAKCCPEVAHLTSLELLARFREEVSAAELAHAFPAEPEDSQIFFDQTMSMLEKYPYFLNQWQAALLDTAAGVPKKAVSDGLNIPEEGVFACPHFANESTPTWEEAAGRLVYTAHNLWQLDTGSSPAFGNVTAVFHNSVQDLAVFAPIDTGIWYASCSKESHFHGPPDEHLNCSSWVPQSMGTFDAYDHMILAGWGLAANKSKRSVVEQAVFFFERSAFTSIDIMQRPVLDNTTAYDYWEAVLLGAPRVPQEVKFLMPQFHMFGTAKGEHLRRIAKRFSWPLLWVFGQTSNERLLPGKVRVLDPVSVSDVGLNATLPVGALDKFTELWTAVSHRRARGDEMSDDESLAYWEELKEKQLWMAPLTARSCQDRASCFGIEVGTKDCICRRTPHAAITV
mmetsp:Transcript_66075/g.158031  ORF Transcript_66075/g.158031 Transcript_66075/m.158031 type:complete len:472 (+) Transcript_66075:117-1532(+)|eukprot:CAMPEP_0178407076 /NCGR_PEP_ID=MMETSP0689_2-20121128/19241_1 /TAXON_ID=160604 /ORGANISM="Amphidinium massartii, Strain CS-259" /LENGTH=471 /DNA_ID=CAMNT_0020028137 /DNA_START=53 /DNA_END=1468 /DNA_ORIENTATION=+